ncbi:MAG: type II toxin-antitoxin system MqsA family antitoxin [Deltaproteobacteria bacterium]|nr:type II toxin-antitoxin system MqsA family antitoxin [Deltaproteobacteria bacterium]
MICDNCGKQGARIRRISRTYGKGRDILVIENVPIITCHHCGESYLEAETLYEIERIKLHKKSFAVNRSVPVAHFV